MRNSYLLSAILRGKWFLREADAMAQAVIVAKLLSGDFASETAAKKLSDNEPLKVMLDSGREIEASRSSMDSAPEQSTAIIPLHGTMLKYGTYCSYGTEEIANAVLNAAYSSKINSIVIEGHTGGGAVDAISPLFDSIKKANSMKPVVGCVDMLASAGVYALLPCSEIISANNISSEIGSIGVMMSFMDMAPYYEQMGVKQHTIYSSHSDHKNKPFELAKEGKYEQIIAEELDPLALNFQNAVKQYRGAKLDQTVSGILAGRMFFAEDAVKFGLIDSIGSLDIAVSKAQDLTTTRLFQSYTHSKS